MLSVKLNVLKSLGSALLVAATFCSSFGLCAAEEGQKVKDKIASSGPASDALMPMLLALLFVVFVIFAIAVVAKKLNLTPNNSSHFKMISSMSLGGRERIVIIEVQGKQHAIGVTPNNVNHLFSVENPIESNPQPITKATMVTKLNRLFGYQAPIKNDNSSSNNGKNNA